MWGTNMKFFSGSARGLVILMLLASPLGCGKKNNPSQPGSGGTAEPFGSGVFSTGSPVTLYVHTFSTTGTYAYHCPVHGTSMSGTVQVDPAFPDSPLVSIGNNFYSPALVQVKTGSYVKWSTTVSTGHGVIRP